MQRRLDPGLTISVAVGGLILLRLSLSGLAAPLWGIHALFYLGFGALVFWTVLPLLALAPRPVRSAVLRHWPAITPPASAWKIAVGFALIPILLDSVAVPLLGDGIDRLESTMAGWRALAGQPAPLDLALHLLSYRLATAFKSETWDVAWLSWRWLSYLAGGFAAAAVWKLASLAALNRGDRLFLFFISFAGGTMLLFQGYVETYVTLAAACYGFYLLVFLVGRGGAPAWTVGPAWIVLCGLHYFSVLLLPAVVLALRQGGRARPSRGVIAAAAVALAVFAAFLAAVVDRHYGGLAAIFVPPGQWLGGYHLLGFLNQQLLACPAWPVLLPLALTGDPAPETDPGLAVLRTFLGAASLILLVFFFFLRPVIGPAGDWDLFAIPSLAYAPWLALRVRARWRGREAFPRIGWAAMILTAAFTGPWLSINTNENISIDRYRDLMQWESGHNPWAASYGFLRFGKYLGRRRFDPLNPEITGSLRRAIAINPDSSSLRKQVAEAYTIVGRYDEARREMAAHHRLKAAYYERKGRTDQAHEQFRLAAERYGDLSPETRDGLRRTAPPAPPTGTPVPH